MKSIKEIASTTPGKIGLVIAALLIGWVVISALESM